MRIIIVLIAFIGLLTGLGSPLAQENNWTCDNGPDDVLNAAQAAFDAAELAQAYELVLRAEAVCGSGETMNMGRSRQAAQLRSLIELELSTLPVDTAGQQDDRIQEAIALNNLGLQALDEGRYEEALAYFGQVLLFVRDINDPTGEAVTLNNIAWAYWHQEQYKEALDHYQQALAIEREIGDRVGEGQTLNYMGWMYRSQGQYAEALEVYDKVLAITRELGDRAGEGITLNNIGWVYAARGQYDEALDVYQQALAIEREAGDRASEGTTLNNIGTVYHSQGLYTEALDFYQRALPIAREMDDRTTEAGTLNNIGETYRSQGHYPDALDYYQQALVIQRAIGDRVNEGTTINNVGMVYYAQGQYAEALDYYQEALAIRREVGDRLGEGSTLNNIGEAHRNQGRYAEALDYYQEALAIRREIGDRAGEGGTLNNSGEVYRAQGRYVEALDYYQQALAIEREVGNRADEGATLNNIGETYRELERYSAALDYYQQALAIEREVGNRAGEGTTLNNMALAHHLQEQYAEALDFYQQALIIERQLGDQSGEGTTLNNMGLVYRNQGQYTEALDFLQQGLTLQREVGNREGEGGALNNIGAVYDELGQLTTAIDYYQQAIAAKEDVLQAAALDEAVTSLAGENANLYARLTTLLIRQGDLLSALEYAERGRGILTRDELRGGVIDFRSNLDDQNLLHEEERLRLAVIEAQNRVNALDQDLSASNQAKQNAQTALDNARAAYDSHLERMQLQGGYLAREITLDVASLSEIQSTLPEETTLSLYGVSPLGGYVLLITGDDLRGFTFDATTEDIETAVRAFAADRQANGAALRDLYTLVFAPIADEITTENLIISPDGVLNYVPFAALQASDGSYLIDHYTVSMIPSGTALVLLHERGPNGPAISPALVLAQRDGPGLPRLQFARSEAETIAASLGVTAISDATENDLRSQSLGSSIIHISAHAELDRFAPLFSVIHLGKDGIYDGRFEVREIYELDLTHGTELIILSGCETASGGTGEDFGLLSRAFFASGAEQVVASLWSVDDAATADLLTVYINSRPTMLNDAGALREAMLYIRETHPEPYYWASFVLSGLP